MPLLSLAMVQAAEAAVRADAAAGGGAALPGLIFNGSKTVVEPDLLRGGAPAQVPAGRLECTMQNLADTLVQRFPSRVRFPFPLLHDMLAAPLSLHTFVGPSLCLSAAAARH